MVQVSISIHPSCRSSSTVCHLFAMQKNNCPSRSHRPVPCAGVCFVKDSQIHCRHYCPCALSHMKPNQYSAVLDWKPEAVPTRIYWFLSFSPVPSFFSAQALPLRPGSKALSFSKVWGVQFQTELCSCVLGEGQGLLGICVFTDLVSSLYSWFLA